MTQLNSRDVFVDLDSDLIISIKKYEELGKKDIHTHLLRPWKRNRDYHTVKNTDEGAIGAGEISQKAHTIHMKLDPPGRILRPRRRYPWFVPTYVDHTRASVSSWPRKTAIPNRNQISKSAETNFVSYDTSLPLSKNPLSPKRFHVGN